MSTRKFCTFHGERHFNEGPLCHDCAAHQQRVGHALELRFDASSGARLGTLPPAPPILLRSGAGHGDGMGRWDGSTYWRARASRA